MWTVQKKGLVTIRPKTENKTKTVKLKNSLIFCLKQLTSKYWKPLEIK